VINVQRDINVAHLFVWKKLSVHARKAIKTSPTKSVRRLVQQIGVSTSTAWKICRDDLSLFSYKMQLSQPLSEDRIGRRYAFARQCATLLVLR
jgi:hypothetical protein